MSHPALRLQRHLAMFLTATRSVGVFVKFVPLVNDDFDFERILNLVEVIALATVRAMPEHTAACLLVLSNSVYKRIGPAA